MIPFEELVAALDRWRMRNGLPVVTGELPVSTSTASPATPVAGVPAWNTYAAPAASYAQAYAAPAAAAPAPAARPPTDSDVLALDDADVAAEEDEALYQNEGDDFSMQFGGAPAPAPAPAAPAPVYDEGEYGSYEDQQSYSGAPEYAPPAASGEYASADSYAEHPGYGEGEEDAAGAIESEEEEEDWSKMPGFPGMSGGSDTIDADDDVVDERTVVGDDRHRRDD